MRGFEGFLFFFTGFAFKSHSFVSMPSNLCSSSKDSVPTDFSSFSSFLIRGFESFLFFFTGFAFTSSVSMPSKSNLSPLDFFGALDFRTFFFGISISSPGLYSSSKISFLRVAVADISSSSSFSMRDFEAFLLFLTGFAFTSHSPSLFELSFSILPSLALPLPRAFFFGFDSSSPSSESE